MPLQLSFFVESFIKRGVERGWYDPPGANQMGGLVNALVDAYGKMETIKLTPIPVAHLYVSASHTQNSAKRVTDKNSRQDPSKASPRPIRLRPPLRHGR